MIKGCAKRVVVVRDIDSTLFEEAFFIVKSGQSAKKSTEEFLGEAERLVKATPKAENAEADEAVSGVRAEERFRISPKGAHLSKNASSGGTFLGAVGQQKEKPRKKAHFFNVRDAAAFFLGFGVAVCGMLAGGFIR